MVKSIDFSSNRDILYILCLHFHRVFLQNEIMRAQVFFSTKGFQFIIYLIYFCDFNYQTGVCDSIIYVL